MGLGDVPERHALLGASMQSRTRRGGFHGQPEQAGTYDILARLRGCAAAYMPELNVICGIADYSTESDQPVTKHLVAEITAVRVSGDGTHVSNGSNG